MLKPHKKIITGVSILVIISFAFIPGQLKAQANENYPGIKFKYETQHYLKDGRPYNLTDSMYIYFDGNYTLYHRPYSSAHTKAIVDNDMNVKSENIRVDTLYHNIIYNNPNKYGYQFDSVSFKKVKKMNIDTFRSTTLWARFPFYEESTNKFVSIQKSADKYTFVEKYVCKEKKNDTYTDTMYYYFDKRLIGVNFSLSREMDSLKHAKLVKVLYIFNNVPKGQLYMGKSCPFDMPKRVWTFEISAIPPASKALTNFIEQFKSKEKELYPGN